VRLQYTILKNEKNKTIKMKKNKTIKIRREIRSFGTLIFLFRIQNLNVKYI